MDAATQVGPLVDRMASTRSRARAGRPGQGRACRSSAARRAAGLFFEPTVLAGRRRRDAHPRGRDLRPGCADRPLHARSRGGGQANGTPFGLAAYLWTRDLSRAFRVAEALDFGIVGVNDGVPSDAAGAVRRREGLGPRPRGREVGHRGVPRPQVHVDRLGVCDRTVRARAARRPVQARAVTRRLLCSGSHDEFAALAAACSKCAAARRPRRRRRRRRVRDACDDHRPGAGRRLVGPRDARSPADEMRGRETGSPEHRKAADYVAEHFNGPASSRPATTATCSRWPSARGRFDESRSSLALVRGGKTAPVLLGEEAAFGMRIDPAPRWTRRSCSRVTASGFPKPITTTSPAWRSRVRWWCIWPAAPRTCPGRSARTTSQRRNAGPR